MGIFGFIWAILIGFVVGLIARAIMPGVQAMGFWMTTIIGIVGSFVGGFIATLFSKPAPDAKFHTAGCLMSVIGAVVVLWLWRLLAR
jgi:uncharacterized membrane protein YeaQ/YmgE (transglycosylase-associated protein family)